jgi:predicted regulator of Ras-like GTPase activity (Roadblock/LC7/MglB family)
MEKTKSLRRGLTEISNQFLSNNDELNNLERLLSRVERLEKNLGLNPPDNVDIHQTGLDDKTTPLRQTVGQSAKSAVKTTLFQEYKDIISTLRTDTGKDYIASGIFGINGIYLIFDTRDENQDGKIIAAYLAEYLNNTKEITNELNWGKTQLVTIGTPNQHILLHSLPDEQNYFLCLVIKKYGNIGLASLLLEKISAQLILD